MYYCEFWPDHTMCKYKVRSLKTDLIIKNLFLMIVDAGANRGMLREGVADRGRESRVGLVPQLPEEKVRWIGLHLTELT